MTCSLVPEFNPQPGCWNFYQVGFIFVAAVLKWGLMSEIELILPKSDFLPS